MCGEDGRRWGASWGQRDGEWEEKMMSACGTPWRLNEWAEEPPAHAANAICLCHPLPSPCLAAAPPIWLHTRAM